MSTSTETSATGYVTARFTSATTYADGAKTELNSFLAAMATAISDFADETFTLDYTQFPANYSPAASTAAAPVRPLGMPSDALEIGDPIAHIETTTVSGVGANVASRINAALTTSKVLTEAEETALYSRAVARTAIENERIEDNAMNLWASRGFEVPAIVLNAIIAQAESEQTRNNLEINAEILGKSAELAMQSASTALQVGTSFEQAWLSHLDQINERELKVKFQNVANLIQSYTTTAKVLTDSYLADVEAYGGLVAAYGTVEQLKLAGNENATKNQALKKELIIKEAEMRIKERQSTLVYTLDSLKTSATLSAQVVASALNSVNASASFGFNGSVSDSTNSSESWDRTKGVVSESINHSASYESLTQLPLPADSTVARTDTIITID